MISNTEQPKSLYELYELVERIATSLPNVNTFTESFENLNREDTKYAAVILQFRDGTQPTEGFVTYRLYLGYADRVNDVAGTPSSNETLIKSVGEEAIRQIINKLNASVDIKNGSIIPFEQRLTALTAGVYCDLSITLAVADCNYESGSVLITKDIDIVSNGDLSIVPEPGVDGFRKVNIHTYVPPQDVPGIRYAYTGNMLSFNKFPDGFYIAPRKGYECQYMFYYADVDELPLFDTSQCKNIRSFAEYVTHVKELPDYDFGNVVAAISTFKRTYALKEFNIKMDKLVNAESMFEASAIEKCNVSFPSLAVATNMFNGCSQLTVLPASIPSVTIATGMFKGCSFETVPRYDNDTINLIKADEMFAGNRYLKTVNRLNFRNVTDAKDIFKDCVSLETLGGFSLLSCDFDLSASNKITHDSLLNVINRLAKVTETKTLTLGETNLAKLSDAEKKIATDKGWVLN